MKKKAAILDGIDPRYFWDIDRGKLDVIVSKRLIIERIFSLGKLDEMKVLLSYYGKREVVDTLCQLNYLDPKTLNFISKFFNKPKSSFKCYTRTPLTHQHWNS